MPQRVLPLALILFGSMIATAAPPSQHADVVVYGSTSGGVMASVQAARQGKSVLLVSTNGRLGGLTSSGLGKTDILYPETLGGLNAEFYQRVSTCYDNPENWFCGKRKKWNPNSSWGKEDIQGIMLNFEPHVAEELFNQFVAEQPNIQVISGERLNRSIDVLKQEGVIQEIEMESGLKLTGKIFLDCTYEGDLMDAAGVSFTVGREANSKYNETANGIQLGSTKHQFPPGISPYVIADDPTSGLLPNILPHPPGKTGDGDNRIQAYCFRLCLTDNVDNRLPFRKPEGYQRHDYTLLKRLMERGVYSNLGNSGAMPNCKTDTNNHGPFSSDFIGMNHNWPLASYAERDEIYQAHKDYQMGMWYYLTADPETPAAFREKYSDWGLAKDEFQSTGGWPHELYVREGRRMLGRLVMTEKHCQLKESVDDPIARGGYNMDSHHNSRYVTADGDVRNEGDVQNRSGAYEISYRAITPKSDECRNLLVPVCLSASHIAYGSIRMEPVFMYLGQSAGSAAALSIDHECSVQSLDYNKLSKQLVDNGQLN